MNDSVNTPSASKAKLTEAMKVAMRSKDKERLLVIRTALAAFKQIEVDERIDVDEARSVQILDKMLKQRKDSLTQYTDAGRDDLAKVEAYEIGVIKEFLPAALNEDEIAAIVKQAVIDSDASEMKDMGKVMALVKPQVQGKGDMGSISALVKAALN